MKTPSRLLQPKKVVPPAAILLVALLVPMMIRNDYYMHLVNTALVYLIAVYGLNFITGMAGQINLGTAGIFCMGAYASGLLTTKTGMSAWLALIPAIAIGLLIGIVLGYPSLRVSGVYLTLTTVAFTEIVRLIMNNWTDFTGGALGIKNIPNFYLFGMEIKTRAQFYYLMLVVVVIFTVITYRIVHSKWGRAFIAVRDNVEAVESCGINLAKVKITAFTLATVFGAVAGSFYAHCQNYVNPVSFTMDMSVLFVVMMMFGGVGKMYGNILGVVIITLLPELLRFLGGYYQLVYAAIVMLFAIFLPGGLLSIYKQYQIKKALGKPKPERL